MKIRHAEIDDTKEIYDLIIRTPELQGYGEIDPVYSEEYVIDCIKDNEMNIVLVSQENNKIVGMLIAEIWKNKEYSFLVNLVVLPEYRNQGLGTKLYEHYEEYCKNNDIKTIIGLVQKSNNNMQDFCEKKGYRQGKELYLYTKEI